MMEKLGAVEQESGDFQVIYNRHKLFIIPDIFGTFVVFTQRLPFHYNGTTHYSQERGHKNMKQAIAYIS